eukprot:1164333-Alexandrium_andersonii.AAC.1
MQRGAMGGPHLRFSGKPSRGDGYEFGELARNRACPTESDGSVRARWGCGLWPGRPWGTAARI